MITEAMRMARENMAKVALDENVPTQISAGLLEHVNAMLEPLQADQETVGWTVLAIANTIMGSAYAAATMGDSEPAHLLRGYAVVLGALADRILTNLEIGDLDFTAAAPADSSDAISGDTDGNLPE